MAAGTECSDDTHDPDQEVRRDLSGGRGEEGENLNQMLKAVGSSASRRGEHVSTAWASPMLGSALGQTGRELGWAACGLLCVKAENVRAVS